MPVAAVPAKPSAADAPSHSETLFSRMLEAVLPFPEQLAAWVPSLLHLAVRKGHAHAVRAILQQARAAVTPAVMAGQAAALRGAIKRAGYSDCGAEA